MNLSSTNQGRLLSLDFLRGLIMVLLALESAGLYEHLSTATDGNFMNGFFQQFFHHPWNGLRFWDLVQPAFMFMSGTAMALSLHKQQEKGLTWASCHVEYCSFHRIGKINIKPYMLHTFSRLGVTKFFQQKGGYFSLIFFCQIIT